MEDENLSSGLSGIVIPALIRTVGYRSIQVVEESHDKVNVELVGNLILRLERSGVHYCQRVIADLRGVERLPDAQHDSKLFLLGVKQAKQNMSLCSIGKRHWWKLLMKIFSHFVVLVVVKMGTKSSRSVVTLFNHLK